MARASFLFLTLQESGLWRWNDVNDNKKKYRKVKWTNKIYTEIK